LPVRSEVASLKYRAASKTRCVGSRVWVSERVTKRKNQRRHKRTIHPILAAPSCLRALSESSPQSRGASTARKTERCFRGNRWRAPARGKTSRSYTPCCSHGSSPGFRHYGGMTYSRWQMRRNQPTTPNSLDTKSLKKHNRRIWLSCRQHHRWRANLEWSRVQQSARSSFVR